MHKQIYLDYAATTYVRDEVINAMVPYMKEIYGNPSSIHSFGQKALQAMTQCLLEKNPAYRFEVETNGTITPSAGLDATVHQYNVSPKLENSGNTTSLRRNADALAFFAQSPKAWFKFVISSEDDLAEVDAIIASHAIPQDRVLLMPEGRDEKTLQQRRLWLADICRDRNFRYSDRLHIQLWGSRRGV